LIFYGKDYTVEELLPILLKDKDFYDNSGGGVTLSGGECLLQADFCAELLKQLKKQGVCTAVDTSGMVSKTALDKAMPYTDVFLYDIKAISNEVHKTCTGYGNKQILDNLLYIEEKGAAVEVRIPFVPDFNDEEIDRIGEFLGRLRCLTKVRVLPYHNLAGTKYRSLSLKNTLPNRVPTEEELQTAVDKLKGYGLSVVR
jgi:pyruvate formate lyase activating enzyme